MQGVFPKRKNYKSRPVRCWCCLIGGFGHAFARIIRRIDVGDRKRSVAVKNNCPTVSPAVVAHARRHRTKTTRIEHRVIRSPYLPFTAFSGVVLLLAACRVFALLYLPLTGWLFLGCL